MADNWVYVRNLFPADLDTSAKEKLALQRRREISCAEDLLRMCLAYGLCDMSLRETAAWAEVTGIGRLSDVAVLKRLQNSADWLGHLILVWMQDRGLPTDAPDLPVRLIDASVVSGPGSTGTDWRLHLGLDLQRLRIRSVELTGPEGGETFTRHPLNPGEIAVGDRGYGHRPGVAAVLDRQAHVLTRIGWQNFPLIAASDGPLDILRCLELLAPGEIGDWQVAFEHDQKRYPVRLVAIRKSAQAAEKERVRVRRRTSSRKGRQPHCNSLRAAGFIFVVTDLPADVLPAVEALELYRLRWQVEIFFKRLKSILDIDRLRARDERLARTYLYANIVGALIVEELRDAALAFFPWGYPLRPQTAQRMAAVPDAH
ncbi:MAG: transposase [Armatimonadota bacterium]